MAAVTDSNGQHVQKDGQKGSMLSIEITMEPGSKLGRPPVFLDRLTSTSHHDSPRSGEACVVAGHASPPHWSKAGLVPLAHHLRRYALSEPIVQVLVSS